MGIYVIITLIPSVLSFLPLPFPGPDAFARFLQDPLEHYGTPLPQRAAMALLPLQSVSLQDLFISPSSAFSVSSAPSSPSMSHYLRPLVPESSSRNDRSAKSPDLRLRIPKSPSLRVPTRSAPVPPPRRAKKVEPVNG